MRFTDDSIHQKKTKNGLSKSIVQKINLALQDYRKDVEDEKPDSVNFEKRHGNKKTLLSLS